MARARVDGGRALVHGFVTCGWQGGLPYIGRAKEEKISSLASKNGGEELELGSKKEQLVND